MIYYFVLLMILILIGFLGYYSFYLLFNSGGSSLYQNISITGLLGLLISLINFFIIFNYLFDLFAGSTNIILYSQIIQIFYTYFLFRIWEIRHNQLAKQNYKSLIIGLSLFNLFLLYNSKYKLVEIINLKITSIAPMLLNTVVLSVINVLFLRFNKLSKSKDFQLFPIVVFILLSINLAFVFVDFSKFSELFYFSLLLLQTTSYLIMCKLFLNDYKNSFYY